MSGVDMVRIIQNPGNQQPNNLFIGIEGAPQEYMLLMRFEYGDKKK
jgi:hypothetical protein